MRCPHCGETRQIEQDHVLQQGFCTVCGRTWTIMEGNGTATRSKRATAPNPSTRSQRATGLPAIVTGAALPAIVTGAALPQKGTR
jgi:hypothetical protein